ncbi:hypothetical protein like AT5G59350 [Hibiscus trionum]|uniref:Uncharacterized protein n=1 Tax=Hibiscus trionum TaxID=183268 RepID=A0A9W7LZL4_HIBTR|nr:hypothetical protein like AT5G59350 [Hibiscus trionum]
MKFLSSVGLGLSIVFVVLFLALIAELYYLLWWKKSALNPQEIQQQPSQLVNHLQSNKDLFFKPYDDNHDDDVVDDDGNGGDGLDPPRSLFTIVEETKEDLESEEAKSKKGRSLSDVVFSVETPYLTPLASPPFLTPPLTPLEAASCCYNHHGSFNPLFESSNGGDFNILSSSSPPPKLKFLQEAKEKLHRKKGYINGGS